MEGPKTDPNEYAYEIDADEIEREIESPFAVNYDGEIERWYVGLVDEGEYPHFMISFLIGMEPEEFQKYLKENFHAETWWESFSAYYITRKDAEAAKEWIDAMHVMASMNDSIE